MSAFDKHISIEYPDERTSIITLKLSNNQKEEVNQERNGSYITFLIFTAILLGFFIPFTILNEDTWAILIIPVILIWICYSSTIKHYVKFSTRTKQIIIDGHIQRIKVAYNRVSTKKEKEIEQIFLLNKPLNQIRKIYTHQHFGSTSDY